MREKLEKYKRSMDRMYCFFLAFIIVTEFFKSTPIVMNLYLLGLQGFDRTMPQLSYETAKLIISLLMNLPLLVAIPAVYVIIAEMKTGKERVIGILFLLLGWFYSIYLRKWNDGFLFRTLLLIVASYGKDFRKIAKISIAAVASCLLVVTVLSIAGVIPAYDMERNGRVRHSFGVYAPTGYAAHLSMTILTLLFLRNGKLRWFEWIFAAVLAGINIVFIDGRVSLLTTVLACAGAAVYGIVRRSGWKIPEKIPGIFRKLLTFSYLIIAGIYLVMMLTYDYERNAFYRNVPFLSTFEGRIGVPHRLLSELGLSLFGNYLNRYWPAEYSVIQIGEYNFLDSSYARMLLIYGVVGLALTLWIFTKVQWRLMKRQQTFRMYLLAVLALDHVVERFLMDPMYHVFMLLFFATIPSPEQKQEEITDNRNTVRQQV